MKKYVIALDAGHHLFPRHAHRPRRPPRRLGPATRSRRSTPSPAGSSTTRRTSSPRSWARSPSSSCPRTWIPPTSIPSASPTSARPPSCGTAPPASPSCNAIVWQCRRTAPMVEAIASDPGDRSRDHARAPASCPTPTSPPASSPGSWTRCPAPAPAPRRGSLLSAPWTAGSIWKLTDGAVHATDVTNASRTMLYNIHERRWDPVPA